MKNLEKTELIGAQAEITDSANRSNIGIKGRIIDETKNCITIMTENGEKKMIKDNIILNLPEKNMQIKGKNLSGRPEERIKKKSR